MASKHEYNEASICGWVDEMAKDAGTAAKRGNGTAWIVATMIELGRAQFDLMKELVAKDAEIELMRELAKRAAHVETAQGEELDNMLGGLLIPRLTMPELETDVDYRERAKRIVASATH